MGSRWAETIEFISNGEPVNAGVAGRPDRALAERTEDLRDRLNSSEAAQALRDYDALLADDTYVGGAVYWDSVNQQFANALAASTTDPDTGQLQRAASAEVIGIVGSKSSSTLGDVLLLGKVVVDLAVATGEDEPVAGVYYLSTSTPGGLTRSRPAVPVPVLYYNGDGTAYVFPATRDFADDHAHYAFDLVCLPAGDTTSPGESNRHVVNSADSSLPGWLPSGHEVFEGKAPSRAVFGYNLSQHPKLQRLWPPVPIEGATLFWDRGSDAGHPGGVLVPLDEDGLAVIDANGIWWLSDCYADVPWPAMTNTAISSAEVQGSSPAECLRTQQMRLRLFFNQATFATSGHAVTRLTTPDGSPLSLVDTDNNAAERGDLVLRYDSSLVQNVLPARFTARDGVEEVTALSLGYQSFPSGTAASLYATVAVPTSGLPATPRLRLRLTLMGLTAGELPELTLARRRLPYTGLTPTALPLSETEETLAPAVSVLSNQFVVVESELFTVVAGDTILLRLTRGSGDGYLGAVGLLELVAVLSGG